MNRDEADRWLATLGGAHDRIAAAMYAIDSHPALGFLRGQGLTGRTAAVATAVAADVDALWAGFGVLGDLLEQARATRTGRRPSDAEWSTLTTLLTGPCVVVDAGGQPTLQPPGGPVTPGSRIRATDFAAIADTRTVAVTRQLDDVNASWTSAARAVAPVTEAMTALTVLARDLGEVDVPAPLDRRVTVVRDSVLADPVAAAPGGRVTASVTAAIGGIAADIATTAARLRQIDTLRADYPRRIDALLARIDALADAEDRVDAAYARAIEKIAVAGLPPEPAAAPVLRARVAELDRLRAGSAWRRLADAAATISAAIDIATARAADLVAAADGLLGRRDELRGRLEGYRVKAADHRLDEHDELAKLHHTAHTLLYTAPCDLPAATRAVYAYQRTLTDLIDAGNGRDA